MIRLLRSLATTLLLMAAIEATAADIKGRIIDQQTREPLIGATVQTANGLGAATDADGLFSIGGLQARRKYTLTIKYIGYNTASVSAIAGGDSLLIQLAPDTRTLGEVKVTALARRNTEAAALEVTKKSTVVMSSISAQEIRKTQDNNAGEVIRRVPGVSLIDEKFVMVRGLSQRYNNVWINGGAVPSSESDARAFSFDIIPSGQIDNLSVVKSPSAEFPADFTGGFIQIDTKDIPAEDYLSVSVGGNWNDATSFSDFLYAKGSPTDFLGFDSGRRSLDGGIAATLRPMVTDKSVSLADNGFNNDWRIRSKRPLGDLKLGLELARRWTLGENRLGLIGAVNYTNEYRTYKDMENNLFGVYDVAHDHSNYLRHSIDDQYNNNVRIGAMLNLTYLSGSGNTKIELKNIFNQLATDRYTWREGYNAQSDNEQNAEYYYRSRSTYNLQLSGKHTLKADQITWNGSYSYANRHLPDRRRYRLEEDGGVMTLVTGNDVSREFTKLDEHIASASVNDDHQFSFGRFQPSLKSGLYGEYRTRTYRTREFIYNWEPENRGLLPADFRTMDIAELLSGSQYFGSNGLYLLEEPKRTNDYEGSNLLGAAYLTATLPFGRLNVYAGLRFEYNRMELVRYLRDDDDTHQSIYYRNHDLFPSLNAIYRFNDQHQLRMSYGKSVNRPEFREVSPSVYYDFDLAANVQGRYDLRSCYIHNVDLRYEYYPSRGEAVSVAAFYKYFDSPIEWTYTVSGGTDLIYSYENAKSATSVGVEVDVRKRLDFVGLRNFSLSFNGALIHSRVSFPSGSRNADRPMQGQSPYLVNAALFYNNDNHKLNIALLYNIIGKRIIGVGRSEGSTGDESNVRVPDSYEMPRHSLDLTVAKAFLNGHLELKANVRNILGEKIYYKQFADVANADGITRSVEQITRCYNPGRNIGITATYKF